MKGYTSPVGIEKETPQGYIMKKYETGWMLKHRAEAERMLGRPLRMNERVRFHDGDKTNCDHDNLYIVKIKNSKKMKARVALLQKEIDGLKELLEEEEAAD